MKYLTKLKVHLISLPVLFILMSCANLITNEVTVFQEWPSNSLNKTFIFDKKENFAPELENKNYKNIIKNELLRIGFKEVKNKSDANYKIDFSVSSKSRDIIIIENTPSFHFGSFFGRGRYHPFGYYSPFYSRSYFLNHSTFLSSYERRYTKFENKLNISIINSFNKKTLYEITVKNESYDDNLFKLMPYLAKSAFEDFPAKNGEKKIIKYEIDDQQDKNLNKPTN